MNTHVKPTTEEIRMAENDFIISKTDTKGKITYCNELFIHFSGYEEIELIDQPHNIIRHPEMPRSIFQLMWQTLQKKQEFFGIIKNMCKNGAYYWTYANVTPSYQDQKTVGYYSVRRQPSKQIIDIFTPIYQQMIEEEARHSNHQQAMDASIKILNAVLTAKNLSYNEFIYTHA